MCAEMDLSVLCQYDTPTICNALEMIEPERRRFGYTTENVLCVNPDNSPQVGVALTATMRSLDRPILSGDELKHERLHYYRYMAEETVYPKICVMQDLDGTQAGRGPFWGEFNTRVHRALGFKAIVTDGSVRDVAKLPTDILMLCRGLRPSHGFVHIVDFGRQVNVFGMVVKPGDVVHADTHGAVSFPLAMVNEVAARAEEFVASEAPIIEACKADVLTLDTLETLYMARGAISASDTPPPT